MATTYFLFCEQIQDITSGELDWIKAVLNYDFDEHLSEDGSCDVCNFLEVLGDRYDLEMDPGNWPGFGWKIVGEGLFLYSEQHYEENHLVIFVQAFIRKWRPDYIFSVSAAGTCDRLVIGEFGGSWLVITKDEVLGGNTWSEIEARVEALESGNFGPEVD